MKMRGIRWALLLIALLAVVGCSDKDDDYIVSDVFPTVADAVEAVMNDSALTVGAISADVLATELVNETYTVIDIRSLDAYNAGHVPGAYHSSLGSLLSDVGTTIPVDKEFVVACYSGQSAGHAVVALKLMGYDAKTLLFGMSSWHTSLSGSWDNSIDNLLASAETTNNNGGLTVHAYPELRDYDTQTCVAARVQEMLDNGFQGISYSEMVTNGLDNYFIVNYFGEADYLGTGTAGVPGHIPGAYQFTPYASLDRDAMLSNLPTDKTIVVYCWTGQHSSQVTAFLNVMGYEALSLKFGSNALFHDELTAHVWNGTTNEYPLEISSGDATAQFTAAVEACETLYNDSAVTVGAISADVLATELVNETYTVIDIRSLDAYNAGHIPGAYHSSLGTLLDDVGSTIPTDKEFVVACYSGQSAGHAVVALRLMGYDAKTLLFGMSNWNTALSGSWDNNIDNLLASAETANNNGDLTAHSFPTLEGYSAATVVEERVEEMLAGGFKGISYSDMVLEGLDNYFIINYFGEEDYLGTGTAGTPGHIPGAYQFTPYASLGLDQMLENIPTDMPVVVYCWTGQHSSQITAYLNILGYEALSLKFGSNALFHDELSAHVWNGTTNEYPLEVGSGPTPQFSAMAEAAEALFNDSAVTVGAISADVLATELVNETYTVIDIRSQDAYDAGHIPGAYHSSLGTLLVDVGSTIPTDREFVVACYSGQSAGHAVVALRLMGYDAKTLLFGMSNWNTALSGSWDNSIDNLLASAETANNNGDLTAHSFPTLEGYSAATVVEERVEEMLAAGFKGISYSDMVLNGLENYFIINYFGEEDYLGTGTAGTPGHIPGAYQFTPYASLGVEQMLENVPSDMPVVVYCWTGQHSSQITAYLNAMGYEAYSLKFGSNALFHDELSAHVWNGTTNEYPLEITAGTPTPQFAATVAACEALFNDSAVTVGAISADALAVDIATETYTYNIIDIRGQSDYDASHIPGAYHSSLGTLLDDVGTTIPTDKPFVVACYSGQSAGHAVVALRLKGYDAKTLLFGMSNWSTSLSGSWDNNIDNLLAVAETTNNNGDLTVHEFPALDSYDVGTVVDDRVDEMLAGGFKGINYADMVLNGLENYFIINYFGEADYLGNGTAGVPGHIPGAYQFTPYASLGLDEMLENIPADMTVVVYCWTGQHSSQITAYLNIMGYDAYSLKFGSNALFHDELSAHVWDGTTNDYPLDIGVLKQVAGF